MKGGFELTRLLFNSPPLHIGYGGLWRVDHPGRDFPHGPLSENEGDGGGSCSSGGWYRCRF